jgi:hypothetical protein
MPAKGKRWRSVDDFVASVVYLRDRLATSGAAAIDYESTLSSPAPPTRRSTGEHPLLWEFVELRTARRVLRRARARSTTATNGDLPYRVWAGVHFDGLKRSQVAHKLAEELGLTVTRQTIARWLLAVSGAVESSLEEIGRWEAKGLGDPL